MTEYLVLQKNMETGGWEAIERVEARSVRGAVYAVVSAMTEPPQSDDFVAVPSRHWQPKHVKSSVQMKLEIS